LAEIRIISENGMNERKQRAPFIRATGLGALCRYILIILIVLAAGWAFSERFKTRFARIEAQSAIADATGRLSGPLRDKLRVALDNYKTHLGIRLRVRISDEDVAPGKADAQSLFIGIAPASGAFTLALPPLARKALPQDSLRQEEERFAACLEGGEFEPCLEGIVGNLYALLVQ
jgi:hypothetical protein